MRTAESELMTDWCLIRIDSCLIVRGPNCKRSYEVFRRGGPSRRGLSINCYPLRTGRVSHILKRRSVSPMIRPCS